MSAAAGAGWLPLSRLSPQLFISLLHHTAAATLLPVLRVTGQDIVSPVSAAALDTAVLLLPCISQNVSDLIARLPNNQGRRSHLLEEKKINLL